MSHVQYRLNLVYGGSYLRFIKIVFKVVIWVKYGIIEFWFKIRDP